VDIRPTYNVLDCFSGYGGFALGLRLAYPDADFRTVAYIEWDKYCQELLQQRFRDDPPTLDPAPIWDDIKSFDGRPWRGTVDILSAGFPCQPHSNAGLRKGADDDRNLWPDTLRIIGEVGPGLVILENVPGILVGSDGRPPYGGTVVGELAEVGYMSEWRVISAADAGAPHLRNRWWLLAYPNRERPDPQNDYDLPSVSGMGLGYRRGEVAYPNADLGGRLHREHGIESAIG
jgi:DNA (cytosine-5)-methyltransferase 1